MSKIEHTHYVDYPLAVTVNGSVVKISFGVGDQNPENCHTLHTVAMPVASYLVIAKHLAESLNDEKFRSGLVDHLSSVVVDLKTSSIK